MIKYIPGIGPLEPELMIIGEALSIKDIYWLAGWLEGEGCFSLYQDGNSKQFRIEFSSTDLDIIERVVKIMRTHEKIYERKRTLTNNGTLRKQDYYVHIRGSLAIQWMMTIYSLMGTRRKSKIKEVIIEWKSYIGNGSQICRKCKGPLKFTVIKGGFHKGKKQVRCPRCIRRRSVA